MTLQIDAHRLQANLEALARVGATAGGGVTRLALTDEDKAGRDLLRNWMEGAGLRLRIDDFGNMIGRRPGLDDAAPILLGSHIDSVRRGGRFDGAYGVLAALEVVRTLNDANVETARPIEVVNWTNEEGVRFEPAMLCSGAVVGRFERDYVYDRTDRDGRRFEDELRRIGYLGAERDRPATPAAYLELHVEQGPVLEAEGAAVGVVQGVVGITWLELRLDGRADHAGPSPMPLRQDALAAAARVISGVEALAHATPGAVATVGRLVVEPNVINTIPGRVVMSVDLRHPRAETLESLVEGLERLAAEVRRDTGVSVDSDRFWTSEPTPFDQHAVRAVRSACDGLGFNLVSLWSGAGHDAKYLQDVCPSGMIFVRSRGGVSHSEEEYSSPEDLETGANVLLAATLKLANDHED
ncbi:MAG: Zn-dependent hydrolase [Chloroflexota bacterium]|nr:Zn-dependent hydrolase [Chloroflexota bacterium]